MELIVRDHNGNRIFDIEVYGVEASRVEDIDVRYSVNAEAIVLTVTTVEEV